MFLIIPGIGKLIVAKRHVANGKVKPVVSKVDPFKTVHRDMRLGIELLCDTACDGIQLHTVKVGVLHGLWQHTKEIAGAHGRLQHRSRFHAHLFHSLINAFNDDRCGVMGIQGGTSGGVIFCRGQQFF